MGERERGIHNLEKIELEKIGILFSLSLSLDGFESESALSSRRLGYLFRTGPSNQTQVGQTEITRQDVVPKSPNFWEYPLLDQPNKRLIPRNVTQNPEFWQRSPMTRTFNTDNRVNPPLKPPKTDDWKNGPGDNLPNS